MKIILVANVSANGVVQRMEQLNYYQASQAVAGQAIGKALQCGALIVGRKTYEMLSGMEALAPVLKSLHVVVLTRGAMDNVSTAKTPQEAVRILTEAGKQEAVLAGGVAAYNAFLQAELVSEMFLGVMPVMLRGDRLEIECPSQRLQLKDCIKLDEETVQLHYSL